MIAERILLAVRVHDVTRTQALELCVQYAQGSECQQVCTPNIDHLVLADGDNAFRAIINGARLAIPDGMGIVYLSWLLGRPLQQNVGGRLLFVDFCAAAARRGLAVFLLGAAPGIAARAAAAMVGRFPGLRVAGTYSPPMGFFGNEAEERKALQQVQAARPNALFVALGAPIQERWIWRWRHEIPAGIAMGIGSTFDVVSGALPTPPRWITQVGLEWLFRTLREPRRLGVRYLVRDLNIVRLIVQDTLRRRA